MLRVMLAALAFLATSSPLLAAQCNGVDLSVGSVAVKSVSASGGVNRYQIAGVVTNIGSSSQEADALQSVDIYQGNEKLDSRGIPPLKARQSYSFSYASMRATEGGAGTTHLRFQLNVAHPSPADSQICNMANDSFTLTF